MKADDPRHGTPSQPTTERVAGCECARCDAARRIWRRNRKLRKAGKPSLVDIRPVRRHLQTLLDAGWSRSSIAENSGVGFATISEALNGTAKRMRVETATRLLQLTAAEPASWRVSSLGTIRRLQALAAIGWPIQHVCKEAGMSPRFGALLMGKDRTSMTREAADAIAKVYDRLHMTPAPDRAVNNHVRVFARNRGWITPLAWENIDDPHEQPTDWQYIASDRATILRELDELGAGVSEACRRLKRSREALEKWCQNHDLNDLYSRLVARETVGRGFTGNQHREAS